MRIPTVHNDPILNNKKGVYVGDSGYRLNAMPGLWVPIQINQLKTFFKSKGKLKHELSIR